MPEYADSSRTRDETPHERHERWAWIHETASMTGWDFSPLSGRLVADDPPWDFDQICLDAMADSHRCLDMGTGGGERLSELIDRLDEARPPGEPSPTIAAAEGWEPNVPLAASMLEDYGVEVSRYDSDHHPEMPWGDDEFDLVMNRHESYDLAEVARVLSPGGLFPHPASRRHGGAGSSATSSAAEWAICTSSSNLASAMPRVRSCRSRRHANGRARCASPTSRRSSSTSPIFRGMSPGSL